MTKRHLQAKYEKAFSKKKEVKTAQDAKLSVVEAVVNTIASMVIFLGFGLPIGVVLGMTLSMFIKNIGIRRLFAYITTKRKSK